MSVLWIAIPAAVLWVVSTVLFVTGLCKVAAAADEMSARAIEQLNNEDKEAA